MPRLSKGQPAPNSLRTKELTDERVDARIRLLTTMVQQGISEDLQHLSFEQAALCQWCLPEYGIEPISVNSLKARPEKKRLISLLLQQLNAKKNKSSKDKEAQKRKTVVSKDREIKNLEAELQVCTDEVSSVRAALCDALRLLDSFAVHDAYKRSEIKRFANRWKPVRAVASTLHLVNCDANS